MVQTASSSYNAEWKTHKMPSNHQSQTEMTNKSADRNPQSAIGPSPSELHDATVAYSGSTKPGESTVPEPWSHPWHDELGLRYHRAIAEKICHQPALLALAKENLRRWLAAEPEVPPSKARQEWRHILDQEGLEEIIRLMTDPSEEGHRRRQSAPLPESCLRKKGEQFVINC